MRPESRRGHRAARRARSRRSDARSRRSLCSPSHGAREACAGGRTHPISDADGEVAERVRRDVDSAGNETITLDRREGSIVPDDLGDRIRHRHLASSSAIVRQHGWTHSPRFVYLSCQLRDATLLRSPWHWSGAGRPRQGASPPLAHARGLPPRSSSRAVVVFPTVESAWSRTSRCWQAVILVRWALLQVVSKATFATAVSLALARQVVAADPALDLPRLALDRVAALDRGCVLRGALHWPLSARALQLQPRGAALDVACRVLQLQRARYRPLSAVYARRRPRLPCAARERSTPSVSAKGCR